MIKLESCGTVTMRERGLELSSERCFTAVCVRPIIRARSEFKFDVALCPQRLYELLETRTTTSTLSKLLRSDQFLLSTVQYCFTSTETVTTISDGKPWTATSTFTQLLSSLKRARIQQARTKKGPYATRHHGPSLSLCSSFVSVLSLIRI